MKLTPIQFGIILLAAGTALTHIVLAVPFNLIMFYLNGAGYLVLTAALFLPQLKGQRRLIRWILIAYTAITIIGWAAIGNRSTIAYINKINELALIALLWIDGRQA
jgi:hypothetical protein